MNAAIRAVVRTGAERHTEVQGVSGGYAGLLNDEIAELTPAGVHDLLRRGGSTLGCSRCGEFGTDDAAGRAIRHLERRGVEGLIVIGGDGSQAGARRLSAAGFPVVGLPFTMDNDLHGTEISVGVDTALNVAVEAVDDL